MKREIEETRNIYQNVFYLFFVFKKHGTQIVINLSLFLVFKVKQQKTKNENIIKRSLNFWSINRKEKTQKKKQEKK